MLLTCKMTTTFVFTPGQTSDAQWVSQASVVSVDEICEVVKNLGFGCDFIGSRELLAGDMSKDSQFRPLWNNTVSDFSDIKT